MRALDRWTNDPVVRGVLSTGNVVAAVCLGVAWFSKASIAREVWPMAFVLALVPLHGDAHQRYWDYARTEWLHAAGFVSRARLATACIVQEIVEALLRAFVLVLLTLHVRSTREGASLYSWLTLGCASWIGMLAAWTGVLVLVRASWSLAVNLDGLRSPHRRDKVAVGRNESSDDSSGPILWPSILGWIGLAAGLLAFVLRADRGANSTAQIRGSVLVRLCVALAIALPPCVLGLWLERAWIPAVFGGVVLVLLLQCVGEKEFANSVAGESGGRDEREHSAGSEPSAVRRVTRETDGAEPRKTTSGGRVTEAESAARPTLARILFWDQLDRSSLLGIGALLLLVMALRWIVGGLPTSGEDHGSTGFVILVFPLLFVPGRLFRWTSTGEQAEFLVGHGRELAWLRRAELVAGLGIVTLIAALCCLLIARVPQSWAEWSLLLVASAQALIVCNATPATPGWRVRDASTVHGVLAGISLAMTLSSADEPNAVRVGFGFAATGFLVAASLWVHGWWRTYDDAELRTREARFAERR